MSDETNIRRGARNGRYTALPNRVLEDARLSMETRWLLSYLLSKPDNWTVRLVDIMKRGGCGRDKARTMLNELVKHGYAEKEQQRADEGKFGKLSMVVFDEPRSAQEQAAEQSGGAFLPQTGKPSTADPSTANPPLVNTDEIAKTDCRIERERAGVRDGAFDRALKSWPTGFTDSREAALDAWWALTEPDRASAASEVQRYVRTAKAVGRSHVCAFATYLHERRWEVLPPRPVEVQRSSEASSEPKHPPRPSTPTPAQMARPDLYPEIFGGEAHR